MKYAISGVMRATGAEIELKVDAGTEADAVKKASKQGVVVAKCQPAYRTEKIIITGGVVVGVGIVATLVYVLFIRDHWENANRASLLALKTQGDAFVRDGKLSEGKAAYDNLFQLLRDHEIHDAGLKHDLDLAKSSMMTASDRLAAMEAERGRREAAGRILQQQQERAAAEIKRQQDEAAGQQQEAARQQQEAEQQRQQTAQEEEQKVKELQQAVDSDTILCAVADANPLLRRMFERPHKSEDDRSIMKTQLDIMFTRGQITMSEYRHIKKWMDGH